MTEQTGTYSAPPGPGPGLPPPRPTLHRSRSDRKVAGVAGGLAAYFGIDPIILRIFIVVLSLFGGSGLLIYAAGWLLLPDEGEQRSEVQKLLDRDGRPHSARSIVILTLVIIGIVIAIGSIADGHWWLGGGPGIWPLLVVGGIATLIWYGKRQPSNGAGTFAAPQAPATYVPYAPPAPYTPYQQTAPTAPYVPYQSPGQAPGPAVVAKPRRQ
jgi:phage shock protein PspC (stress-responsive transcriptional regulator)